MPVRCTGWRAGPETSSAILAVAPPLGKGGPLGAFPAGPRHTAQNARMDIPSDPIASLDPPGLEFTPAAAADAEALVALRIAAMRESLERIGRFDPQRARDRFLSTFAPEQTQHLVLQGER